jgi:F420H(2)-dependent quinone reductase
MASFCGGTSGSWNTAAVPRDKFYSRASQAMGATGLRWTGRLNVPLYRLSGGRVGGRIAKAPVLLLTTTGRKSGQQRTAPVVYLADGERLVVIGSNAGHSRTPAWSLNLKANPDAEVEVGRERRPVRARIAEGEERAELWRRHNDQYAGFDEYEARTDRDIAVFVLEPATS